MSGKSRSPKVRNVLIIAGIIVILALVVFSVAYYARIVELGRSTSMNSTSVTSSENGSSEISTLSASTQIVGSQTYITLATTLTGYTTSNVGATFVYPISINYSGSWSLHYWINFTSVKGNLTGSGNSEITITFSVVGYAQYTLCANATKLDSSSHGNLALMLFNANNSTTASDPSAKVCGAMGV